MFKINEKNIISEIKKYILSPIVDTIILNYFQSYIIKGDLIEKSILDDSIHNDDLFIGTVPTLNNDLLCADIKNDILYTIYCDGVKLYNINVKNNVGMGEQISGINSSIKPINRFLLQHESIERKSILQENGPIFGYKLNFNIDNLPAYYVQAFICKTCQEIVLWAEIENDTHTIAIGHIYVFDADNGNFIRRFCIYNECSNSSSIKCDLINVNNNDALIVIKFKSGECIETTILNINDGLVLYEWKIDFNFPFEDLYNISIYDNNIYFNNRNEIFVCNAFTGEQTRQVILQDDDHKISTYTRLLINDDCIYLDDLNNDGMLVYVYKIDGTFCKTINAHIPYNDDIIIINNNIMYIFTEHSFNNHTSQYALWTIH
jgi:hypothetical protein